MNDETVLEMDMTPQIDALAAALAKAQGAMSGAKKDTTNPHFNRRYADLASVWDAIRAPLSSNGLAVLQLPEPCATGLVCLRTMLVHSSGQWIRSRLVMPVSKPDAQGYGSAITYARRYALMAIAGIAPDDDDGEEAVRAPAPRRDEPAPRTPAQTTSGARASFNDAETAKAFAHRMSEAADHGDLAGIDIVWKQVEAARLPEKLVKRLDEIREESLAKCRAPAQNGTHAGAAE